MSLLMYSGAAAAQASSAPSQAAEVGEVVVTGTNVVRNGYKAPTPLTVVGQDEIRNIPRPDLADTLNVLPAFSGSTRPQARVTTVNGAVGGVNALSLRGLGVNKTLTLLDGARSVAATTDGQVDVSEFPQELVARVDVVTGGASANYGSDAVTGVVNFVLDKTFVGTKGEISGGQTEYGDDKNWRLSLSNGFGFAGGKGHVLLSGEIVDNRGVLDSWNRDWARVGNANIADPAYTPTNGRPQYYHTSNGNYAVAVPGGVITAGPFKGTTFGENGTPRNFTYGSVVSSNGTMVGGDQNVSRIQVMTLDPKIARQSFFGRVAYDVTDHINIFAQAQYAHSHAVSSVFKATSALNIQADNAFLPSDIAARAATLGVTTIPLGFMVADATTGLEPEATRIGANNLRTTQRFVVGASGDLPAFGTDWRWNAHYQRGTTDAVERVNNNIDTFKLAEAVDSVRVTSANIGSSGLPIGSIVCRSTLTSPTNGCVPYNPIGLGMNSPEASGYIVGNSRRRQTIQLDSAKFAISGEPLSTWAGPISVAFGLDWRKEQISGTTDATSKNFRWWTSNYQANNGEYTVREVYAETVVPLATDAPWARLLEISAAVRATDYSTFGSVSTWKVGGSWSPIDDVRVRATYSHDIRAPNLGELYAGGSTGNGPGTRDPFLNTSYAVAEFITSNPNLVPEEAYTTGVGVVLQPSFIRGFSASVDYWNIDVENGISVVSTQQTIDQCFQLQVYCDALTRSTTALPGESMGRLVRVVSRPYNLASQTRRGIDFDVSYNLPLDAIFPSAPGQINLRAMATRYLSVFDDNGLGVAVENLGADPAKWQYNLTAIYSTDRLSFGLTANGFSSGVWNTSFIECTSGCPASTALHPTVADNHRPGVIFLNAVGSYKLPGGFEAFGTVQNLLDEEPEAPVGTNGLSIGVVQYDYRWTALGRVYRGGIRFRF